MISNVTVSQLCEFDEIIDVRTPAEYDEDHIPGAKNYPVLSNAEREHVGTIYKQTSSFEAKKIGAALVAKNIAHHVEHSLFDRPKKWHPLVYCWRGGNRSSAFVHVLDQIGWRTGRLDGGYKAYRSVVLAELQTLPSSFNWRVICGPTGSGKSRLLQALEQKNAQVLDLEQLAAHRGSVLGNLPNAPQPSQKSFESAIWNTLRQFDHSRPVYVESESKKIGRLQVPQAILQEMWQSPCLRLEMDLPHRVELLKQEYAHFLTDSSLLTKQIECLQSLYGKQTIADWSVLIQDHQWGKLVFELLERHYDPAYTKSTLKHFEHLANAELIAVTGSEFNQVCNTLLSHEKLTTAPSVTKPDTVSA